MGWPLVIEYFVFCTCLIRCPSSHIPSWQVREAPALPLASRTLPSRPRWTPALRVSFTRTNQCRPHESSAYRCDLPAFRSRQRHLILRREVARRPAPSRDTTGMGQYALTGEGMPPTQNRTRAGCSREAATKQSPERLNRIAAASLRVHSCNRSRPKLTRHRAPMPPASSFEMAKGFSLYMLKAVGGALLTRTYLKIAKRSRSAINVG